MKQNKLNKLLATLLTMAALFAGQNAWAQTQDVTLTVDPEIPEGTAGHWYVNMLYRDNQQLTLSTEELAAGQNVFKVYDNGGKNGNYSSGCRSYLYITVPDGYLIQASGTVWTKEPGSMTIPDLGTILQPVDFLTLYNANSENNSLGMVYSDVDGEGKDFGPLCTHEVTRGSTPTNGQYLTVYFFSKDSPNYAGFDMTVTVFENVLHSISIAEGITNGTVSASTNQAYFNNEVTLTVTPNANYYIGTVSYNDGTSDHIITPDGNGDYKFLMPQYDVTVSATFVDEVGHLWGEGNDGSEEHPYVISSQEGWNLLITKETATNGFTNNKHFRLDTDLTNVTQSLSRFGGHLDGNGHTITLNMTLDNNGLINSGINCTISNLTVEGSINNNIANVGGFVASSPIYNNNITLTDCHSSVTITSTYSGNDHHCGGLVGNANNVTCERCVFDGAFVGSCYGFSGLVGHCSQLTLTDCIVVFGSTTSLTSQQGVCFSFADCNRITGNGQNFYYNKGSISGGIISQGGTQTYTLTLSEPASIVRSNGTAIGNGAGRAYADGFTYGNEEYYIPNATVTLSAPAGIRIASATYNGNAATLNSDGTASFTMPATNTTATITGFAANYIDTDGTLQTHAVNLLSSSDVADTKPEGWYAVVGDVTFSKSLTFSGDAHLILTDGATLNVDFNNTGSTHFAIAATNLSVYGQALGTGALNASSINHESPNQTDYYAYGIQSSGNITFCGGDVNATATGKKNSGGHGAVYCYGIYAEGSITIIRGCVSASAVKESGPVAVTLYNIFASNGVLLDWRLPTDRIRLTTGSSGNCSTVSVAEGKSLWNGTEVLSGGIGRSQFNDKTLQPCITREVTGYGTGNDKWAFIASPVTGSIDPTTVGGLVASTATEYDLYRFNQSAALEWQNYKVHTEGFVLENGKGYLCATKDTQTLAFMGDALNMGTAPVTVPLVYDGNAEFAGWNLVGNPFTENATLDRSYYVMNTEGTGIVPTAVDGATPIAPCTGVLVQATAAEQTVTFTKVTTQQNASNNQGGLHIALTQANTRGNALLDNAIVSFNEGSQLGKFYFGEQNGNIYIPQGNEEYAIVSVGRDSVHTVSTEVPINFKAKENGEYTISVNPEGVAFGYLHLIDNMTGADADLLASPEYTFTAKTTDYASRFKLVFANENDSENDDFAFISNGEIIVHGEGTLRVIDVLGHVIVERRDGACTVSTAEMTAGVYVLRLINGEKIKTQKIVIG